MTAGLSDLLLSRLSDSVGLQTGLHFPPERWPDLERGILSAARKLGYPDGESCAHWLLSAPFTKERIDILASELTIGETYFFREKQSFGILAETLLPEMARQRQGAEHRLRIWSAGCCTGEEPYSMAILLDRFLPQFKQWKVTILATDVNSSALKRAREGLYGEWSFRDVPPWLRTNYFTPAGKGRFQILDRIKSKVTFTYLNLAEEVYPSLATHTNGMDLIFCRNVLMYFTPEVRKRVIQNFHRSLDNGGWLSVNPAEASYEHFPQFRSAFFEGAAFYQKEDQGSASSAFSFPLKMDSDDLVPELWPEFPLSTGSFQAEGQETVVPAESRPLSEANSDPEAGRDLEMFSLPPRPTESLASRARACADLGELTEALCWVEKAIRANKFDVGLHYLRAVILQEQGAPNEAIEALGRALYLDPNFVLAHFALGHLVLQQKNFNQAEKHFINVLALLVSTPPDQSIPHSEGLVAGRLREMVESALFLERSR